MRVLVRAVTGVVLLLAVFVIASCGTSEADGSVERVGPRRAVELIAQGDHVVVDARSAAQFEAGHVEGAAHLDVRSPVLAKQVEDLDQGLPYLVYAQSRERSSEVADLLVGLGVRRVVDAGAFGLLAIAGAPVAAGD